jgi:hypothetical protein
MPTKQITTGWNVTKSHQLAFNMLKLRTVVITRNMILSNVKIVTFSLKYDNNWSEKRTTGYEWYFKTFVNFKIQSCGREGSHLKCSQNII